MRKHLKLLSVFIVIICLFSSCAKDGGESYVVYEISSYDYTSNANHKSEKTLRFETNKEEKKEKEKKFKILDNEFTLTYDHTLETHLFNGKVDYYYSDMSGDEKISVGVNQKNNRIDVYNWVKESYLEDKTLVLKTRDECFEIAEEYFSNYADVKDFTLNNETYNESSQYGGIYQFEFVKYINGIQTCEIAYIDITQYGTIKSHVFRGLETVKNNKLPDNSTIEKISNNVDTKLDGIYDGVEDTYEITYGEKEFIFTRFLDGEHGFEIYVDVTLSPHDMNAVTISERNHFVVYID